MADAAEADSAAGPSFAIDHNPASSKHPPLASSSSSSSSGGFDCNICLDLAQDPVVTLCGHLFCWPCLYRWLHCHSTCQECPVCKALVEEDKLVPLYARGTPSIDPRNKPPPPTSSLPSDIPHRPLGNRPQTASPPDPQNPFIPLHGFNFVAPPPAPVTAGFGILSSLLGFHLQGSPHPTGFGAAHPMGFHMGFHGAYSLPSTHHQPQPWRFKLFMLLVLLVLFCVLLS